MKKILHLISSCDLKKGGPIVGILGFSRIYKEQGTELTICCLDNKNELPDEYRYIEVISLGPAYFRYGFSAKFNKWLLENYKKYDQIIINGLWQYIGYVAYKILKQKNYPYFVFPHGMLDPSLKQLDRIKHIKKQIYFSLIESKVLSGAKSVIFTCEEERLLASKGFYGYKAIETVIPYGIPSPPLNVESLVEKFYQKFSFLRSKEIVLFLGRIDKKKGCEILIKSFSEIVKVYPDVHLVIAGDGSVTYKNEIKNLITEFNISKKVSWAGMLWGDYKWGALYASSIFCLPSYQENFGIAVVEALACGLPVITTFRVNIWQKIESCGAGFIGKPSEEDTSKNLKKWLNLSVEKKLEMKEMALRCYFNNFRAEEAVKSILKLR